MSLHARAINKTQGTFLPLRTGGGGSDQINALLFLFEPPNVGCYKQSVSINPTAQAKSPAKQRDPLNRAFYLPRLAREYYQGDAVVHWTLTISNHQQGWLTPGFHGQFRELMLHTAARQGLACPIYCLMPDHVHLIWMGLRWDSDQLNGMAFLRTYLEPALKPAEFQHQAHDNVLREQERQQNAFAKTCFYIAANPARAGLIAESESWPFTGCVVPGYPKLNPATNDFWQKFWKIYALLKQPDAGNIKRPPL
jgi:putative transposase